LGDTTTGASNDIEKATQIARAMVTKFGMSEKLGPVTFGRSESSIFLNREINEQRDYSDSLANQIDVEIKALIEEAQRRAHEVVTKYLDRLNALVDKLIIVETLEAEEFEKLFVGLPKDLVI
jgi:cell division protease FtsH